jgi:6-phosphogluconolactonase
LTGEPVVVPDPAAAAEEAARRIADALRPGANVMLTGGSTPRAAYERLAEMGLDWAGVTIWLTDDRCVPPDHEHSNFGMIDRVLLTPLGPAGPAAKRIEGELGPEEGGRRYDAALHAAFGGELPEMGLILLGLGPDAHICSLFPGDAALGERERFAVGVETPGMAPLVSRVTVTLPVVNAGRALLFLVTGADKADAVRRAFVDSPDPSAPGSLVEPLHGPPTLLLDEAAAAGLGDGAGAG